jgi:hypothetical protein
MSEKEIITYIDNIINNLSRESIQKIYDKYILISLDKNKLFHDCPIHEIMKYDLCNLKSINMDKLYKELRLKYSDDIIDKIILKDEEHIMKKILDILKFIFEKIYKEIDKIIVVINNYQNNSICSIPVIIYRIIISNYSQNIISQDYIDDRFEITISNSKRT